MISDTGNYDIPRNSASSDYDIPRAITLESNYDVPRSNEDIRMSTADNDEEEEKNEEAPSDVAVWFVTQHNCNNVVFNIEKTKKWISTKHVKYNIRPFH